MPLLDVSDLLYDPDFATFDLECERNVQTVSTGGIASNATYCITFAGVVTSDSGDILERLAEGARITGGIMVCTHFPLIDGRSGYSADVIEWRERRFTVVQINDYTHFGAGFVEARCEPILLSGGKRRRHG